ncbi:hypothetical protein H4R18_004170, partial [Coemansia javaensis]
AEAEAEAEEETERWGAVRELRISLLPSSIGTSTSNNNSTNNSSSSAGVALYEDSIEQASAALASLLPGVRRVQFGGVATNLFSRELFGQLAGFYSAQLSAIKSLHPITVHPDTVFRRLASASIHYDGRAGYRAPRMDPCCLVSLSLAGWPANHSWAPFSADGSAAATIEFPRLRTLNVRYTYNHHHADSGPAAQSPGGGGGGHHQWKKKRLSFPALRKIRVECAEMSCPILEYMVLPPQMDSVAIDVAAPALLSLHEAALPIARSVKIGITHGARHDRSVLAAANRILTRVRGHEGAELDVYDSSLPVTPESITCASLTGLLVSAPTSVDAMLGLIQALPSLASLWISHLTAGEPQTDISIPEPGDARLAEPLNTSIEHMSIDARGNERPEDAVVPVAKYLLLKIPTLASFNAIQLPRQAIEDFVGAYSELYPHLAIIRFRLSNRS